MGLTIFYSGRLHHMHQLPDLVEEVADLCKDLHWRFEIQQPTPKFPIEGLWFYPPGAEAIWLTFLSDGTLANPEHFMITERGARSKQTADRLIYLNSITQYAGPEAHITLINMMHYIVKTYFISFVMIDESEYWETGNAEKCRDWFDMFSIWMNQMSSDLGKLDGRGYELGETVQTRIELLLRKRNLSEILDSFTSPYTLS